jgi:hypothetical protein
MFSRKTQDHAVEALKVQGITNRQKRRKRSRKPGVDLEVARLWFKSCIKKLALFFRSPHHGVASPFYATIRSGVGAKKLASSLFKSQSSCKASRYHYLFSVSSESGNYVTWTLGMREIILNGLLPYKTRSLVLLPSLPLLVPEKDNYPAVESVGP